MYKDPLASNVANEQAKQMLERKARELSEKITDETSSDSDFAKNLFDLCQINLMADSHS